VSLMTAPCRSVSWLLAAALLATVAQAGDTEAEPEKPVDLAAKLGGMFAAGQYRQALAESEPLEKEFKPRARDPQLIPRTKLWVDLLAFRGSIERRMGNLEAAATKYEAGFRALNDKDLQRAINGFLRGGEKAAGQLVPLELTNLEVLDGRVELLLDGLANLEAGEAADPEAIAKPLAAARQAAELASEAREGLDERLALADKTLRQSAYSLMLASRCRPQRAAGRLALAEARLAAAPPEPAPTDEAKAKATPEQAVAKLDEAIAAAEAAMAPALPKPPRGAAVAAAVPPPAPLTASPADLPPAVREAGLVRADLLARRAEARRASGELAAARGDFTAAVAWRRAAQGAEHPDLVEPLTSAAELAVAEARVAVEARDIAESISRFEAAEAALEDAEKILAAQREQFTEASPLPQRIDLLQEAVEKERQDVAVLAGDANAVDAAAARALRLLESLPPDGEIQQPR
jgi:hypothetical protein